MGWSSRSLRRATSCSWSSEVSKKPPFSLVGEAGDHRVGQLPGRGEPARLERRLVEGEQRLEQEGVVLEVGVQCARAVLARAQQPALAVAQVAEHELGGPARAASR